jgi:predicted dehydrogenase
MPRKLRVGMVGYGFMGRTHTHALRSLGYYYEEVPAEIELVAVATHSEKSGQKAMARDGYRHATTDFRELCARDDINIVDCCTPNDLHKDVLLAALENGKHVYIDKPLARSLAEAREMAEAAARHPELVTQVVFQYRFVPALLRAKQLVEAGALGRIFSARIAYLHAGYVDPNRPASWRTDPESSGPGGALFDLGSHVIDLTRHLLGETVEVQHLGETFIKERPRKDDPEKKVPVGVDDVSLLLFRLENGAVGTLESSRIATGSQDEIRFEAHGSKGAIRFNLMQPNYLEYYDETARAGDFGGDRGFKAIESVQRYRSPAHFPGPKNTVGWDRFHVASMYNFVCAVTSAKPTRPM